MLASWPLGPVLGCPSAGSTQLGGYQSYHSHPGLDFGYPPNAAPIHSATSVEWLCLQSYRTQRRKLQKLSSLTSPTGSITGLKRDLGLGVRNTHV